MTAGAGEPFLLRFEPSRRTLRPIKSAHIPRLRPATDDGGRADDLRYLPGRKVGPQAMSDSGTPRQLPTAGVHRRRRIPLVWIIPLFTALIAAWLAWDTFSKRGPTIVISFETAAGLTAGQSQLKYKNVVMGTVKSIAISPDFAHVLVTVETVREAEPFLNDKTIFWVVKPELFAGNITGLETLLSGS